MSDPTVSWRVVAVCAVVVLVGLSGLFRVLALSRTSLSLLAILRREHTRRTFEPTDFDGRWAWLLYRSALWLMLPAAGLVLLLFATRPSG
ncbi:hypothetical protein [Enterovirga rhinocerotis]|uniref:Uncharacterized protein n=1 Tax=Enterovirga rhinocerotis TaxID=1339210 RepID=A0A4R7BZH9_9HYPH|nr:hypothetical protein [Enterovirga rhinocerotis]TDR89627.1 hypothetical protein EV668_2462 [Enterovirga rhinocerotis]